MLSALPRLAQGAAVPEDVALVLVVSSGTARPSPLEEQQAAMRDWGPTVFAVEPALWHSARPQRVARDQPAARVRSHRVFIDDDRGCRPRLDRRLLEEARRSNLDLVGGPVALLPVDAGDDKPGRTDRAAWSSMHELARNRQRARKALRGPGRAREDHRG